MVEHELPKLVLDSRFPFDVSRLRDSSPRNIPSFEWPENARIACRPDHLLAQFWEMRLLPRSEICKLRGVSPATLDRRRKDDSSFLEPVRPSAHSPRWVAGEIGT